PDQALVEALNGVIQQFLALAAEQGTAPAAPVAPVAVPEPVAAKSASSFDSFFDAEARKSGAQEDLLALATPGGKATGGIAGAFAAYATLRRSITTPAASVDAFIAGISTVPKPKAPAPMAAPAPAPRPAPVPAPAAAPPAPRTSAPIRAPAMAAAPPVAPRAQPAPAAPAAPAVPAADGVVEIKDLCYAGSGALARAVEVRRELMEVLANPMRAGGRMRPLLDELLDLVELANRS
ncbi:MAG: hypothetical protein ABJB33_09900, partial [Gemmatimonadota bacterium]